MAKGMEVTPITVSGLGTVGGKGQVVLWPLEVTQKYPHVGHPLAWYESL